MPGSHAVLQRDTSRRRDHHQRLWKGTNSDNIFDTVRPRSSKNSTGVMCSYISAVQAGCRQPRGVRISFTLQRAAHRGSICGDVIKEAKNITEKSKNQRIIIYAKTNEISYFFCPCCATHNKLTVLLVKQTFSRWNNKIRCWKKGTGSHMHPINVREEKGLGTFILNTTAQQTFTGWSESFCNVCWKTEYMNNFVLNPQENNQTQAAFLIMFQSVRSYRILISTWCLRKFNGTETEMAK